MPTPEGFLRVTELVWPLNYIYTIAVPWGYAKMEITVDAPELLDKLEETSATGTPLFDVAIAPAISFRSLLLTCDIQVLKYGFSIEGTTAHPPGRNSIFALGKDRGVVALLQNGYTDRHGARRIFFPSCPKSWVDDVGQLTHDGAGKMLGILRGWFAGFSGTVENAPYRWLTYHREAIKDPLTGFKVTGFRDVTSVRLCQYTVPVPDVLL